LLLRDITDKEKTITCGKLEPKNGAVVEYGIVKELGLSETKLNLSGKEAEVKLDGITYKVIIK